jgi:hypothetical protein
MDSTTSITLLQGFDPGIDPGIPQEFKTMEYSGETPIIMETDLKRRGN